MFPKLHEDLADASCLERHVSSMGSLLMAWSGCRVTTVLVKNGRALAGSYLLRRGDTKIIGTVLLYFTRYVSPITNYILPSRMNNSTSDESHIGLTTGQTWEWRQYFHWARDYHHMGLHTVKCVKGINGQRERGRFASCKTFRVCIYVHVAN